MPAWAYAELGGPTGDVPCHLDQTPECRQGRLGPFTVRRLRRYGATIAVVKAVTGIGRS